jgi:riboflavin kinase/FMN adenylyltransferase
MHETFVLTGAVVRGNQLGRTIGFPTANLIPGEDKVLSINNGVYAARVKIDDKMYDGMANIGIRPTLDQHTLTVEVHIFDFSEDLYDQTISIFFYDFIRPERKFSGLEELKSQLAKDKITILDILSGRAQTDTDTQ